MKKLIFLALIPLTLYGNGSQQFILNEDRLDELTNSRPPSVREMEVSFLAAKEAYLSLEDTFTMSAEGSGNAYRSKERLLSNFDGGVTRRSTTYSLGLIKPTKYGLEVGVKAFGAKVSNAFINRAATTGISLDLSMDLYKNFLGRITKSSLEKGQLSMKRALIEKNISVKTFKNNLRKIYWAIVANNEQKNLLENLVELSRKQFNESKKRNKSGVADYGEVARYRSLWTTRKASLLSQRYQLSELFKTLKELLPDLNGRNITLGAYDVEKTVEGVLACSKKIRSYSDAPFAFTMYDEMIDMLNKEKELEKKVISHYNDPSIRLNAQYASVGRDFGLEAAQDNLFDSPRARTSIGVNISIPLGGAKKRTLEVKQELLKNRYDSKTKGNLSKIKAYHSETSEIIGFLNEVVKNQKEANRYLEKSMKVSLKKYKQARISVQELISEQDSLVQSKLNEIQTKLKIINTLMDYFSIYTETPCELNRI